MSIYSSLDPRTERMGPATATSGANDFQKITVDKNSTSEASAFFLDSTGSKLTNHPFAEKSDKSSRTFSPFGGSWDYSEVD